MRVAHVTVSYQEGLGYEENHLPFFQAGLDAGVSIVTTPLPLAWWRGLDHFQTGAAPGVHEERGVRIHRLKARFQARKGTQFLLQGLRRTLTEIKPDILHIHNPVGSLTVQTLAAAKALGLPVVIDCHLWRFLTYPHRLAGQAYYGLFRRVFLRYYGSVIKRYIPLGPDPEEVLHNLFGIPYSLMAHSTLGADTSIFRYDESARLETRRALGIPAGAKVILFGGRIDRGKEIDVLVEAWKTLPRNRDARLLLVGPAAPGMADELARAARPEASGKLILTGHVANAELPNYMSAADVAVWPGNPGITMNEAMACHTALVHSDAVAGRHLTLYGNGAAFQRGNARSLAGVLDSILGDPSRLADMRLRSRRLAEEVFDWRVVAKRTLRIYEDVLQGTRTVMPIWGPAMQGNGAGGRGSSGGGTTHLTGDRASKHKLIVRTRFDKIAATYEDTIATRRQVFNDAVDRIVSQHVRSQARPLSVLDAACGTGARWTRMKEDFPEIALRGFDASPQMVEIAASREGSGFDEIKVCDLTGISFPDESFDLATCLFFPFSCLASAADRRRAAAELGRVLRPNGLLFVDAINRWHLGEGEEFRRSWPTAIGEYLRSVVDPNLDAGDKSYSTQLDGSLLEGFMHGYSKGSFRRLFTNAGLTVEREYVIGYDTGNIHSATTRGNILLACRRKA